jgi:hypothetical protein
MYLAPIPPLASQFPRLLARLQAQQAPGAGLPADADALFARLRDRVLPRAQV